MKRALHDQLRWLRRNLGAAVLALAAASGGAAIMLAACGEAAPIDPSPWMEQGKLTASDGAADDHFGFSAALSGDTALVGGFGDAAGAYVFVQRGADWIQEARLVANDGAPGDGFGISVALSEDTALVGAFKGDDSGGGSGSAYVFVRRDEAWTQEAKLVASDADAGDEFGISVALSGDTALVGSHETGNFEGSAYVFVRSGGSWTEEAKLVASDETEGDSFGGSVALSGETALVGSPHHEDENGDHTGSAYVFVRSGGSWTEEAKLLAVDGAHADNFGGSVALSGDIALVGASKDDDGRGSAYAFVRSGGAWTQEAKLLARGGAADELFGHAVAIAGETALVGSPFDNDHGYASGSVHLFTRSAGVWTQETALVADDRSEQDLLGVSVALSDDTLLAGAAGDDGGVGSVRVFVPTGDSSSESPSAGGGDCRATGGRPAESARGALVVLGLGLLLRRRGRAASHGRSRPARRRTRAGTP